MKISGHYEAQKFFTAPDDSTQVDGICEEWRCMRHLHLCLLCGQQSRQKMKPFRDEDQKIYSEFYCFQDSFNIYDLNQKKVQWSLVKIRDGIGSCFFGN
jgi:hypothetical protein